MMEWYKIIRTHLKNTWPKMMPSGNFKVQNCMYNMPLLLQGEKKKGKKQGRKGFISISQVLVVFLFLDPRRHRHFNVNSLPNYHFHLLCILSLHRSVWKYVRCILDSFSTIAFTVKEDPHDFFFFSGWW